MEPDTRTEIIRHGDSGEPSETNSVGVAEPSQVGKTINIAIDIKPIVSLQKNSKRNGPIPRQPNEILIIVSMRLNSH